MTSPHATTTLPSFSSQKEKSSSSSSSLESHFTLSKSRVNDAVETLEKNILENTRKRERELVEKKTLIDRLYERLELTREMVAEGEQTLTKCESKLRKTKEENEMLRKVLEECKMWATPDTISYNAAITACEKGGQQHHAVALL